MSDKVTSILNEYVDDKGVKTLNFLGGADVVCVTVFKR